MLTHIVVWKYKDEVDAELRREHIERLSRLPSLIEGIESFDVGSDELRLPRSYDTGLVAVFHDRSRLDAYTIHPEHILVAELGRTISEHVVSVDFSSE